MEFKTWFINEDIRLLVKAYSDSLRDVPQDPHHHPEGSVLNHVKLVRKSILAASRELQNLKLDAIFGEILSNLDFVLSEDDIKILNLSAWLHDIGKSSSTTVDGAHYSTTADRSGKIQAIGHESPEHYMPQVEKLIGLAPSTLVDFYNFNKEIIDFLIQRHMDFAHGGFSKKTISGYFENGKIKNDRRIKLLLVLMWADKMGRGKAFDLADNINKLRIAAEKSGSMHANLEKKSKPFEGGEKEFRDMLAKRGLNQSAIDAAVASKFGLTQ